MKRASPRRQALALLRAELDHLQRHGLAPTQQAIIRRMIAHEDDIWPIFEQVWNPAHLRPTRASGSPDAPRLTLADPDAPRIEWTPEEYAETVKLERWRLLQTIILTAADIPRRAEDRRRARRELPELLDRLGTQARELHATLDAIQRHATAGGIRLPDRLGPGLLDLLTEAALCSPDRLTREFFESHALPDLQRAFDAIKRHATAGGIRLPDRLGPGLLALLTEAGHGSPDRLTLEFFQSHALPELERAFDAGGAFWPDLAAVLYALSTASRADLSDKTEEGPYPIKRQAHALNDFLRALELNLATVWPGMDALQRFTFAPDHLATLAAVCLNLNDDDLPDDPRPR